MYIYMNGELVKKEEASISPFDHGFLYGLGLFETFRIYDGHPFLLDDHLSRLHEGLEQLRISCELSRQHVIDAVEQLLIRNNYRNAYIRLNVSAGNGEVGLQTDAYCSPNIIIFSKPLPEEVSNQEKRAVVLTLRRNTPEGPDRLKSHHYLNNVLAKREIGDDPFTEGIFLTAEGYVAEGTVSNIFWIKRSTIYTPCVAAGILNGITRKYVMRLAAQAGLMVEEGFYRPEEVKQADEIFLTNSIQEIVPVSIFAEMKAAGKEGFYTRKLQGLYGAHRRKLWSRSQLEER